MKLPDFIIPGSTKCGTTALWYNLDKHPDITMATKTQTSIEMNFFGGRTQNKGLEWYKSKFVGEKMNGEKSTVYCHDKKNMKKIKDVMSDVKLILCIRNPVDRAYSNWQMNHANGKIPQQFSYDLFHKRYRGSGVYIRIIENNILSFFDKSQLHICISEYMKADMVKEMRRVFSFLGVSDLNYAPKEIEYMKGMTRQEDLISNRQEKYYRVWSKFKKQLPAGELRNQIIDFYKPLNERLYDYLGYKIKGWDK